VELQNFVDVLQRDYAAVKAALRLPWSNGPVEGHINRLKLIKRSGYGRMQLDLLRQRVLYDAAYRATRNLRKSHFHLANSNGEVWPDGGRVRGAKGALSWCIPRSTKPAEEPLSSGQFQWGGVGTH